MEMIEWSNLLSVGNEQIDKQHGQIVHLVKELEAYRQEGPDAEKTFFFLLSSLMLVMTRHFRDEELVLEKNGCPTLEQHIREHAHFIDRLSRILAMQEHEVPEQVILFMKRWLHSHLSIMDMKCRDYLREP